MLGLHSMTWKCSTVCIDLMELQFLNHTTCTWHSAYCYTADGLLKVAYMFRVDPLAKRSLYKVINLLARGGSEVVCGRVILDGEFCPDDQMHNVFIKAVRPVVVEDLDVVYG